MPKPVSLFLSSFLPRAESAEASNIASRLPIVFFTFRRSASSSVLALPPSIFARSKSGRLMFDF